MVDINTSTSALQAQLQASQPQNRVNARPSPGDGAAGTANPQDVIAPVKQNGPSNQLSSSDEIEDAGRRVAQFTGSSSREAPVGRLSNADSETRDQPLGQIVNILV